MPQAAGGSEDPSLSPPKNTLWPYIGVGCFTAPIGFFGGGMIAVLVAKIAGAVRGCTPPEGFPACHTWDFLWVGGLIGLVGLPALALLRLRRGRRTPSDSNRTS